MNPTTMQLSTVFFPVTEGQYKGRLLELTVIDGIIKARYEGHEVWRRLVNRSINPQCITIYLYKIGHPGDVLVSPAVFHDLVHKVRKANARKK